MKAIELQRSLDTPTMVGLPLPQRTRRVRSGTRLGRSQHLRRLPPGHDDNTLFVPNHHVTLRNQHTTTPDRPTQRPDAPLGPRDRHHPPTKHPKPPLPDFRDVPNHPINHKPGHPPLLRNSAHIPTGHREIHIPRLNHNNATRRRTINGRMQHQTIPGNTTHRIRGTRDARHPRPKSPDAHIHHLIPIENIRERARSNLTKGSAVIHHNHPHHENTSLPAQPTI